MELDDGTTVDVSNVWDTLTAYAATNRVVLHLAQGEAELAVGFRGERGACYWRGGDADDLVSSGGDNADVEVYGMNEIPFPPGSEIDAATVIDAADEFAATGARPTCVTWASYHEAMQAAPVEETITPEMLQALISETDAGR
ncbi:Imm1 family immunity protein [Saccharopolyspora sp. ASAGF58]|uniref:Imm1 family immunity protein n=1 Tax=Saccharopolyspora sp. ASAGF58 TaxID=2719023 RepID=UPI001446844E|nr:Imm1 family immunity protein [Saccharopolyspora sp. ASAGF58]